MMKKILFLLVAVQLLACQQPAPEKSPTAILIHNVNIVDVTNGSILENHSIVVDSGTIRSLLQKDADTAGYQTVISGEGRYAVPGLAEMHAHIPSPPVSQERTEETLFLYLSNGITTIRGMLGHPSHLVLREQASEGELLSPRIYTSSTSFNGNTVPTPEAARDLVMASAAEGYDFLKIHPGVLRPVFDTLVATARREGIPFAGHVPVDVGIRHALENEYASIDHVDGFLEGMVPESADVNPGDNGFFGYNFTPLADTTRIEELVALSREKEVWIVPTQSLFERWFAPISGEELLAQPEMKYMPKSTLETWGRVKSETMDNDAFNEQQWAAFDKIRLQLIKALHDRGHGLVLGSDAPQLFNVPGFSIHHEMAGMLRAGLSPVEILRIGTLNPAAYFGESDSFGSIDEGKSADLFLVSENPLDDITHLQHPSGVMVRGHWISQDEIHERLDRIAAHASEE